MTVRLTVQRAAWEAHVAAVAGAVDGLLPVVKGNGYGFGRPVLHALAAPLADHVCVGTVHELDHLAADTTPIVLTPTLVPPPTLAPILTVGALEHVAALAGWPGRVVVKLRSSMRRFGVTPDALANLLDAAAAAGLAVEGAALHLPLAGDDHDRIAEIEAWLAVLPDELDLSVSHLSPTWFAALQHAHPHRRLRLRVGTALWHGDKSFLHLGADVLDVQPLDGARHAGYHGTPLPAPPSDEGTGSTGGSATHVVLIGAGTANGVAPLDDGRSPFHFGGRRLALVEPPHMHTAMCITTSDQPVPRVGDIVDVQRPLITTKADELAWM